MPIDSGNLALKGLDDLFSTEENRQEEQREQVQQIPIDALHPFINHPFKVLDDEAMTRTVESIAQYGVLAPLIARPRPDGDGYEIISGHRRQHAAQLAGLETLPVIVRNMDDNAAVLSAAHHGEAAYLSSTAMLMHGYNFRVFLPVYLQFAHRHVHRHTDCSPCSLPHTHPYQTADG